MSLILLTILIFGAVACSEEESVDDSGTIRISNSFLSVLDAALLTEAATLSSTDVVTDLAESEHLYANAPSVTDLERDCFLKKLAKVKVQGQDQGVQTLANFNHGIDVDYKGCRQLGVEDYVTVKSSRLRIYQKFECEFIDPSEVEEDAEYDEDTASFRNYSEAGALLLEYGRAQSCTKRTWLLTADITSSITGVLEGDEDDAGRFTHAEHTSSNASSIGMAFGKH